MEVSSSAPGPSAQTDQGSVVICTWSERGSVGGARFERGSGQVPSVVVGLAYLFVNASRASPSTSRLPLGRGHLLALLDGK